MSFVDVTMQLLDGFKITLLIFVVTLVFSLPLGLIITFGSMSKFPPLRWLTGIESIPQGQSEAGQVLGTTKFQIFFKVIQFQVIKRITAPMGNEVITLVKDTSLARVVAVSELVKSAQDIVGLKAIIWPIFYIGAFYLLFSGLLTLLFGYLEKRMNYYRG